MSETKRGSQDRNCEWPRVAIQDDEMNVWGWHLWAQGCVHSAGGAGAGGVKGSCCGKLRWGKTQSMKLGQANSTGSQEKRQEARLLPAAVLGRTVGSVRAWAVLHAGVELKFTPAGHSQGERKDSVRGRLTWNVNSRGKQSQLRMSLASKLSTFRQMRDNRYLKEQLYFT